MPENWFIKVLCRVRPLDGNAASCVRVASVNTLQLTPPEVSCIADPKCTFVSRHCFNLLFNDQSSY